MPPARRTAAAVLVAFVLGCSADPNGRVTGRITHKGQPVANAIVMFVPASGVGAGGATNADGTYELTSRSLGDGARIGPCKVAVRSADPVNQPLAIPKKYQHAEQSGLTADVQKGSNVFDFDIPEM